MHPLKVAYDALVAELKRLYGVIPPDIEDEIKAVEAEVVKICTPAAKPVAPPVVPKPA